MAVVGPFGGLALGQHGPDQPTHSKPAGRVDAKRSGIKTFTAILARTDLGESSGGSFNVTLRDDAWFEGMLAHHEQRGDVTVNAYPSAPTKCVMRFGLASSKFWAVPAIEFSFRRVIRPA